MTDPELVSHESDLLPLAPLSFDSRDWQRRGLTQVLCAVAVVIPFALVAYRTALIQSSLKLQDLFLAPILIGSTLIFWTLFLHLVVCADRIEVFGFRKPGIGIDLLLGIGLAVALLAFHFGFYSTVARLFPPRPPAPQIFALISGVARDPLLLAIWLGPVVWVGVALFEELARVFLLRRLWLVWHGVAGRWLVILFVSVLVGLVHAYQGKGAIVAVGVESILLGWFFLRTGRIRSLIVAHAVYDSAQIVMTVAAIRQMGP